MNRFLLDSGTPSLSEKQTLQKENEGTRIYTKNLGIHRLLHDIPRFSLFFSYGNFVPDLASG